MRLSKVEYAILDQLRYGKELFGLEMVKASDGALKRGTIYVTLQRMGEKGLLTSRQEKNDDQAGKPRRLYRITGLGERAVQAQDAAEAVMYGRLAQ